METPDETQAWIADRFAQLLCLTAADAAWVQQALHCFPVPTVRHAPHLIHAIGRVAATVRWASELVSTEDVLAPLGRILEKMKDSSDPILYTRNGDPLLGDFRGAFLFSGTLFDVRFGLAPSPGVEALRLVLVACQWAWAGTDNPRVSTIDTLASAIRGTTDSNLDPMVLVQMGRSRSLSDFIEAASGLASGAHANLARAWEHDFDPFLRGVARPRRPAPNVQPRVVPRPPAALPPTPPKSGRKPLPEEDAASELFQRSRRSGSQPRPRSAPEPLYGELLDEVSPAVFVPALPRAPTNPDSRAIQRYQVQQAVWNTNHLLLANHPDVLPFSTCAKAVQAMLETLGDPALDPGLGYGTCALLVQALTGRTAKTLTGLDVLADGSVEHNPMRMELLLAEGAFRLSPFWQVQRGTATPSYFRPDANQQAHLEATHPSFLLPLAPPILEVLRAHAQSLETLSRIELSQTESWLRHAARHLGEAQDLLLTPGQLRASFATHLFEQCRDMAAVQLICADTLGQSIAPLSYYAPTTRTLASIHWSLQNRLLEAECVMPAGAQDDARVGSQLLLSIERARVLAREPTSVFRHGVNRLLDAGRVHEVHRTMVNQLAGMLVAVATHRPTQALFKLTLSDIWTEDAVGAALFRDKVIDAAHDPRLVALPSTVCRQLKAYLEHLVGLGEQLPALGPQVDQVLAGTAPLLFGLSEQGALRPLDLDEWKQAMPASWRVLPMNWGRHWARTYAVEAGVRPELVNIQMGHLDVAGYPFSGVSPTEPWLFVEEVAKGWEAVATGQHWHVVRGIRPVRAGLPMTLTPLRSWTPEIVRHEAAQRALAKQWNNAMKAQLRTYRTQAETCVRADPELLAAGIIARYLDKSAGSTPHALTRKDFEKIRDRLYEAAGDDMALAVAHADAVCRVARVVNRRTGQTGETPGEIFTLRRPLDNAFVPGMMEAMRQVRALREHVATIDQNAGAGGWADFASASSYAVLAMALFGHCEHPERIQGAIERRAQMLRPASLEDAVLVPWGDAGHEVMGLRGVAAITFARLARKFRKAPAPDWDAVQRHLAHLLPAWALGVDASRSTGTRDILVRLCETVAVANRYELSPAARRADAAHAGSTPAHVREQIALIDGDPVGALKRTWELADDAAQGGPASGGTQVRKGNPRTQYLQLCAVVATTEKDTPLALTQTMIYSGDATSKSSRGKMVAEIEAQMAVQDPAHCLHPIVRVLAGWVGDMMVHGTARRTQPAISTVKTYLTRIGGALVDLFGHSSPAQTDDAQLEEAYLTAVESKTGLHESAAAAILSFHRYALEHHGFPDLDLSSIKLHLGADPEGLADARLVLPAERQAILAQLSALAENGAQIGAHNVRVARLAAQVMPLMALGGMRRGEALGLQFRDVAVEDQQLRVHVRPNRSRSIKTANARRKVQIPLASTAVASATLADWIAIERKRIRSRRLETAFVFTASAAPFDATARAEIREACVEACRKVTGRASARLHHLRHLVAMEYTTPAFLSEPDRLTLSGHMRLDPVATQQGPVVLPRDLQAQVVNIGHGNPSTTLRSYHHLPWLLSSRTAQRDRDRYLNSSILAPLLGLTAHALYWATKQRPGRARTLAWLDVQVDRRKRAQGPLLPEAESASPPPELACDPVSPKTQWTARFLGTLLSDVTRVRSLEDTLLVLGANVGDAESIRLGLVGMERRLGMRVLNESKAAYAPDRPRRVIRERRAGHELEALWDWYDRDEQGMRGVLAHLADAVNEYMQPSHRDRLLLGANDTTALLGLLERLGIDPSRMQMEPSGTGLVSIRVRTQAPSAAPDDPMTDRYLGLELKRVLLVIRLVARTQ